jgi:maltose phosphorylase
MNNNKQTDPWCIIEEGFHPENQLDSERIFGLGNGQLSKRANFEEFYSGNTVPGTYMSGVYASRFLNPKDPDADLSVASDPFSNLPCWTTLNVWLNAEQLDLARCEIKNFRRALNMQQGMLERTFEIVTAEGHHIEASVQRFLSLAQPEIGAIKYSVKSLDFVGHIAFSPIVNGDFNAVFRPDDEPEWNVLQSRTQRDVAHLWIQTRKTNFQVCEAMTYDFFKNNAQIKTNPTKIEKQKAAGFSFGTDVKVGDSVCVYKFVALLSSLNHSSPELTARACGKALNAKTAGWNELVEENNAAWQQKWETSNISLKGSVSNQQAKIRNEFQQLQPYLGTNQE